jgi:hypothetical protein
VPLKMSPRILQFQRSNDGNGYSGVDKAKHWRYSISCANLDFWGFTFRIPEGIIFGV